MLAKDQFYQVVAARRLQWDQLVWQLALFGVAALLVVGLVLIAPTVLT